MIGLALSHNQKLIKNWLGGKCFFSFFNKGEIVELIACHFNLALWRFDLSVFNINLNEPHEHNHQKKTVNEIQYNHIDTYQIATIAGRIVKMEVLSVGIRNFAAKVVSWSTRCFLR